MSNVKELPYGVSDFVDIRTSNLYYVDKTMYLPMIEASARTSIFIRPRRFGKSSFISMMKAYYDKKMAGRFQELFGELYIGANPTENRNKYQVLHLDFSQVSGNSAVLEERFNQYCGKRIDTFIRKYADDYEDYVVDEVLKSSRAVEKLNSIQNYAGECGIPLFLIIDEYDNFTNVVLNEEGHDIYHSITHASGFYRDVFKVFKGMFQRIFITGVSPVTIDDLTSGFNIGMNISLDAKLNNMLGFSTEDVREIFQYYKDAGQLPEDFDVEQNIQEIRPWYDNYCFAKQCIGQPGNFNTDMVLYYLRKFIYNQQAPENMTDPNTRTDYNKMKRLLKLDSLDGERRSVIMEIAENGEILGNIEESFPAERLTKPDIFISLLYYYGMLTIKGEDGLMLKLGIPNNNVRRQYYDYLIEIYSETKAININEMLIKHTAMARDGEWRGTLEHIADAYAQNSSARSAMRGESNIQGFVTALLSLNSYYLLAPEMEFSHGYCDIFLMPRHQHYYANHSYIIELKYIPRNEYSDDKANQKWLEGVAQVNKYAADQHLQSMLKGTQLHKIVMVFSGWEMTKLGEVE